MSDLGFSGEGPHKAVEDLVSRPAVWRKDRHLPVLVFVGEDDASQVAEQLVRPYSWRAPCAVVRREKLAQIGDTPALVELITRELGRRIPASLMPPPRFPMSKFVLWAIEWRRSGSDPADGEDESDRWAQAYREWRRNRWASVKTGEIVDYLSRALPAWVPVSAGLFTGLGRVVAVVEHIALIGPPLASAAASAVQVGLMATGWLSYRRFAKHKDYFPRQKGEPMDAYHRRLAMKTTDEQLDTLLVHAFCEDLRQAYQRRWPWPSWGRSVNCVLLIGRMSTESGTGGEHVAHRFIGGVHDERERTGQHVPLLVLTSSEAAPPADTVKHAQTRVSRMPEQVRAWRARAARSVACPYLVVDAPEGSARSVATDFRPRVRRRRAALYWLVAVLMVVLPIVATLHDQRATAVAAEQRCQLTWVRKVGRECIGVLNDKGPTPKVLRPELASLIAEIDRQNAQITKQHKYVSLVVLGEYSMADGDVGSRIVGRLGELRSLVALQRDKTGSPRIRILLANAGDEYAQGAEAAKQIAALARRDSSVVGVVGFARSLDGVRQAIGVLAREKIPMVGTTGTADDLGKVDGQATRYYFHVSPTNYRQAALAARYARRTLLKEVESPTAVIVEDGSAGEVYTGDLAADFAEAFEAEGGARPVRVPYTVESGIDKAAGEACAESPDVYFYAGRSPEITAFIGALAKTPCGAGRVKVIAGDDVTREAAYNKGGALVQDRVELYYTSLADRRLWSFPSKASSGGAARPLPHFIAGLLQEQPSAGMEMLADDNLILTYAAGEALHRAANIVYDPRSNPPVSRGDVLYQLARISGRDFINGVSGVLRFDNTDRHDPLNAVIALMRAGDNEPQVRCGQLVSSEPAVPDPLCEDLPDRQP
ncbi:hypothetical protein [Nonomuraea basaltis]|uniref:hypothetical protein n=1 Tax=Nonomuraea basaltis TaxID=2495887 RepID=UPI00110C5D42|nr:hypothetical protein [Nonomuraea basaltis]TMR93112.1 hypothetical protein EJK15_41095 [Nonomuraea basaltis]